jgi:hypothetical protein
VPHPARAGEADAAIATDPASPADPEAAAEKPSRAAALLGRFDAAVGAVEPILSRVVWLGAVVLTAFGASGMLAGIDHPAGTIGRAELTWAGDREVTPAMDNAARDLVALSEQVDRLGVEGRRVLVALLERDRASIASGVASGSALLGGINRDALSIRGYLAVLPGDEPFAKLRIAQSQLARHEVAVHAIDSTRGIDTAWARLTAGSQLASTLIVLLEDHDVTMAAAAEKGRAQAYADALPIIARAKTMLDDATSLRNSLANTTDVAILDQWLRRNRTYDEALEALYEAFVASHGRVTVEVTRAFQLHEAARAQLPPDARGLELIMIGIAQGGLNQPVITIEQAGEQLASALEAMPDA